MTQDFIRNFAIIAHIDHGKSTLADRFLEFTGTVTHRDIREQTLDSHPISQERGITIRLAPVTMNYELRGKKYELNLIDTPGHVDFSYEVERSLAACEGAILLVDAIAGIQAQTLSHFQKAKRLNLKIIPAVNKVDMETARTEAVAKDMSETFGFNLGEIHRISAKTGLGVQEILDDIITKVPAPAGKANGPTRALVFSSQYDPERGVTAFVRVVDGQLKKGDKVVFLASRAETTPFEMGHFTPAMTKSDFLETGEVGYVVTNLRDPTLVRVGDTISSVDREQSVVNSLPGYRPPQSMVFVSFFPVDQNEFAVLEDSLKKLKLNDAAISFSMTSSKALGRGFRCGFLGHLHAEISQERLEDDFGLNIIATMPTVEYRTTSDEQHATNYEEPWVAATILVPQDYLGAIISLCEDRRGKLENMEYHGNIVILSYDLPLAEIITDFFDRMKSVSSGYASMDYELLDFRPFDAVKLDILVNHESVDAFSEILPKEKADKYGKFLVERLKEIIPRQQIPIALQAAIDGQIIARADIAAYRKDVTAKLYGGDYTRRLKLLEKQKKGKKKMKTIGRVEIPNDTFLKIFRT